MALHGKEKIWFLVNRLIDEREITPAGQLIGLHPANDLNNYYLPQDFINLLSKLEKEENAAKFISLPTDQTYLKYQVKLLPGFDKYVVKLEEDPEYLEWSGKKPKPNSKGYFYRPEQIVDFSLGKEENQNRHLTGGSVMDYFKLPEKERDRIAKENLTEKQVKEINDFQSTSEKLAKSFTMPSSNLAPLIAPPNYDAEQTRLLRQLVNQKDSNTKPTKDVNLKERSNAYAITYTKSRQILLNDFLQLAQPTFNGENDLVFNFLYQNPNKPFSKKQIEVTLSIKIAKPLHKIVENLGFKGDLARAFFAVSKNSISFKNPVSQDELEQMGIHKIRLSKSNSS